MTSKGRAASPIKSIWGAGRSRRGRGKALARTTPRSPVARLGVGVGDRKALERQRNNRESIESRESRHNSCTAVLSKPLSQCSRIQATCPQLILPKRCRSSHTVPKPLTKPDRNQAASSDEAHAETARAQDYGSKQQRRKRAAGRTRCRPPPNFPNKIERRPPPGRAHEPRSWAPCTAEPHER